MYKLLVLVENYMKDVSGDNVEQNCWFGFKELECEKIVEMYVNETQKTVNTRVVPKEFKFM